jgi:hypothetical protein
LGISLLDKTGPLNILHSDLQPEGSLQKFMDWQKWGKIAIVVPQK